MRQKLNNIKRMVVKVGTSTLTYENGKLNLGRIDKLARTIADIKNRGVEVVLVSSGAIGVGVGKLGLKERPTLTREKQAAAAVGQCELMYLYDKMFSEYGYKTGQVLLTRDVIDIPERKENVMNTFNTLLDMHVVPVVNENDAVSVDEIVIGDNDTLSSVVAVLTNADLLVILTDIDGLFDKDPRKNPDAVRISVVDKITEETKNIAGGAGTSRGTGGMYTKVLAAERASNHGIATVVCNGDNPTILYDVIEGNDVGTLFK